jgi:hypothetical protein
MPANRRSYRELMQLPVWGLYRKDGSLRATIRAESAREARRLFTQHGLFGARVRLI